MFVATFRLKSWSHFQQGWDFILWALSVGKLEGGGCPSALQHGRAVHICVTAKLQGLVPHSSAEPTLSWPKLHTLVPSRPWGTWCELWRMPVMQWERAEGQVLVNDTPAKMAHVANRCSCGQVKWKHRNLGGWAVILPPATGSWSIFLKAMGYFSFSADTGVLWKSPAPHDMGMTSSSQLWHTGDVACTLLCVSADWMTSWHVGVSLRRFHCKPALWVLPGMPEPSSAPSWALHWGSLVSQGEQHKPFTHSSDWCSHFHLVQETGNKKCVLTVLRWKLLQSKILNTSSKLYFPAPVFSCLC